MTQEFIQIDAGLWCLNSSFTAMGCKGSLRMTVIDTGSDLLLHSPVVLSPENICQISQIGQVETIFAPNLFHHMYLRDCIKTYPNARVIIPKGLTDKIGAIDNAEMVGDLGATIEHYSFIGHKLHETILFHRPSGTLITADLLYNYQSEQFRAEKIFFGLLGCYGSPTVAFYHRFAIKDKTAVSALINQVTTWPIRRIIMSHGRIIEGKDVAQQFTTAWRKFVK